MTEQIQKLVRTEGKIMPSGKKQAVMLFGEIPALFAGFEQLVLTEAEIGQGPAVIISERPIGFSKDILVAQLFAGSEIKNGRSHHPLTIAQVPDGGARLALDDSLTNRTRKHLAEFEPLESYRLDNLYAAIKNSKVGHLVVTKMSPKDFVVWPRSWKKMPGKKLDKLPVVGTRIAGI